jgi:pimeloyl-ACP methyl ester carboxylesterase
MNAIPTIGGAWAALCGVCLAVLMAGVATAQGAPTECVVLLHGMGRTSLSMKRMEWALKGAGYRVVNVSYPSRRQTVEQLSEDYLQMLMATRVPADVVKVHFVTHSLGGILLREFLAHHTVTNLGRVVMLAPPNHGSQLADALRRHALGRWVLGPAGCQLGTAATDVPQRLGPPTFPLGIIAGDVSLNPFFSRVLPVPNDGKVSVESTKLAGMTDFMVVHSSHTWMMWRAKTLRETAAFLREGRFGARKA